MKIVTLNEVSQQKVGKIVSNGVSLERHEYDTVLFLASHGFDIEFIRPRNEPKSANPDFLISGAIWEAKSPIGSSKYTIQRKIHEAGHQAERLILDLRRTRMAAATSEKEALKRFGYSKRMKRMLLITRDGRLPYCEKTHIEH